VLFLSAGMDEGIVDLFKKITTAGRDPVTTLPAVISIHLLIMRKNINTNFVILLL
jgi:hypothetical protein